MKIKNKKKMIGLISIAITILITGLVVFLNNIILVSPSGIIYDRSPTFIWNGVENNYNLLVDDEPNFNNPIIDLYVEDNTLKLDQELDFGKYYWKIISEDKESITGYFVIDSMIRIESDNKLRNKGNTPILISGITGGAVLDINEEMNIQKGENYTIEQK